MTPYTLRRQAARALLLDREGRVLLLRAEDPTDPTKGEWWELPGGGIHGRESSAETARRELYEEAGITDVEMGPCVWVRHTEFDFAGIHFDQDERIHVAWCEQTHQIAPAALEALEAAAFLGGAWWTVDELCESDIQTFPTRLRQFLPAIVSGELPSEPLDVGD